MRFSEQNTDPLDDVNPAYNVQQLEQCDVYAEDSAAIWCLNGETHRMEQKVGS